MCLQSRIISFKMYENVTIKNDDGASMVAALGKAVTELSKIEIITSFNGMKFKNSIR